MSSGLDRKELARLTDRLRNLGRIITEMGAPAGHLTVVMDQHVVAEHPDLADLDDELRNLYGGAFDT